MTDPDRRAPTGAALDPGFWEDVLARGAAVPADRRLDDMTVELVEMLGDLDPHLRDDLALTVLLRWIAAGVYDDLLPAMGDGISEGLRPGLGEDGTPSVLRRSFSARVLAAVIDRDNVLHGMHREAVLRWGDRGLSWLVAERDLRGHVPGAGRAHALAHAADLLRALARSRHLQAEGLGVLLDTLADRLLRPTTHSFSGLEADQLGFAAMTLLHRDAVDTVTVQGWIHRLAAGWAGTWTQTGPVPAQVANTVAFTRALHLQLLLGVRRGRGGREQAALEGPPAARVEVLATLQAVLRTSGPHFEPSRPIPGTR
ncbi:DUF2785 domain-containing protein [Sporichthya sp.]|uniref:DUF2785 domain-containing protein n=1 Tax=Sporichthya sp. TaxID=65475 RepID=UPI0025D3097A|nr:DUF2785 domain-containing protein [Sporichthya sp.]